MENNSTQLLDPVGRRVSLTDDIAGQLIRLIMDGQYASGHQLPTELNLAKQFQTGRGAVREAVKSLAVTGLVRVERGKGTFVGKRSDFLVRPISLGFKSKTSLQSLIEARKLLEVGLAGLAAERAALDEVKSAKHFVDCMEDYTESEEWSKFLEADVEFHSAIAKAAKNPILTQCLLLIRNLMQEWLSLTLHITLGEPGAGRASQDEHRLIFEAIRDRKSAQASEIMASHLENSGKRLLIAKQRKEQQDRNSKL